MSRRYLRDALLQAVHPHVDVSGFATHCQGFRLEMRCGMHKEAWRFFTR